MKQNYTCLKRMLLCLLLVAMIPAARAQDWTVVNPNIAGLGGVYALTADQHDMPYGFFYNSSTGVYQVAQYTATGWIQRGGAIPGMVSRDYLFLKMRIAPDGTLYLLCGFVNRAAKVYQLQPGGAWQQIGNFTISVTGNYGNTLELDPSGVPYIAYRPSGSTSLQIQKYTGASSWQAISPPTGYEGSFTSSLAFGADGSLYALYANTTTFPTSYHVAVFQAQANAWQAVGGTLSASISSQAPARLQFNRNTNQLSIYYLDAAFTYNSQYFDGTNWRAAGNPLDVSANFPVSLMGDWYLPADGTAYVAFIGSTDHLLYAYKFDGTNWQQLGTPSVNGNVSGLSAPFCLAGDPTHLYEGLVSTDGATWSVRQFQIGKYPQNLTFPAIPAKTYGDPDFPFVPASSDNPSNPITYTIDHPGIANFSPDSTKIHILKAGSVIITARQAGDNAHNPASLSQTLTIGKAALTVTARDTTRAFSLPNPLFRATYSGFVKGEDASVLSTPPIFSCAANASSPVGSQWDIIPSGAAADNYTFTYVDGKLTILATGNTVQTISFGPFSTATYGDSDLLLTATASSSLPVTYTISNPAIATIVNGKVHITGAGMDTITASQPGNLTYAPAPGVAQVLTVNPAPLTITADDQTRDLGQPNPSLTLTYKGFVNSDGPGSLTRPATVSTTATTTSAPGIYDIVVTGATSPNYAITFINGHLTVRSSQIITWNPLSTLVYGDAPIDPGAASNAGVAPVYSTDNPSVGRIIGERLVITGAGTVTITATFPASGGYVVTTRTQTITVQPKALSVIAEDKTRAYGYPNPVFTLHYIGFVDGDTSYTPGVFSQVPVAATTATAGSPVGNYPITASGGVSVNYALTYIPGSLTITTATRSISFGAIPLKTYGDADFDPGATASTGETVTYSSSDNNIATVINGKVHITGAGTATITASLPPNSSYNGISSTTQTLAVNKAPLTITAENKTRPVGGPAIQLTVTYQGLVGGDTWAVFDPSPVITSTATGQSPIGTYPIRVGGAGSPNYNINYVNGTLTIVPAADSSDNVLSAWLSSRSQLEVKLFMARAQHAVLRLISLNGQRMYSQEYQLDAGLNQYQVPVGNLPVGVYILKISGDQFAADQKIMIR